MFLSEIILLVFLFYFCLFYLLAPSSSCHYNPLVLGPLLPLLCLLHLSISFPMYLLSLKFLTLNIFFFFFKMYRICVVLHCIQLNQSLKRLYSSFLLPKLAPDLTKKCIPTLYNFYNFYLFVGDYFH